LADPERLMPVDPVRLGELQSRISQGSLDSDDYRELANLLKSEARHEEAIQIYEKALTLTLTGVQRATVLLEMGILLNATRAERDRARELAEEVIDTVRAEPFTIQVRLLRGVALSLLDRLESLDRS
jgi:tetratricopeptide (TPR) repeat protein